ncbi:MAG: hypothetical protein DCC71_05030 [Proteobacteria bacterium]|nr:MAG: hypothetical protein DCC71_05030 [Pseudomonadota bacterium]
MSATRASHASSAGRRAASSRDAASLAANAARARAISRRTQASSSARAAESRSCSPRLGSSSAATPSPSVTATTESTTAGSLTSASSVSASDDPSSQSSALRRPARTNGASALRSSSDTRTRRPSARSAAISSSVQRASTAMLANSSAFRIALHTTRPRHASLRSSPSEAPSRSMPSPSARPIAAATALPRRSRKRRSCRCQRSGVVSATPRSAAKSRRAPRAATTAAATVYAVTSARNRQKRARPSGRIADRSAKSAALATKSASSAPKTSPKTRAPTAASARSRRVAGTGSAACAGTSAMRGRVSLDSSGPSCDAPALVNAPGLRSTDGHSADGRAAAAAKHEARDPRLDGLRGAAILLVILYHVTHYGLARGPFERALTVLPSIGWSGVDLFFVLSGFLITGILLRTKGGGSYFRAFYARRVLRIFPLYYAVLAFFLFAVPRIELFAPANDFWHPGAAREGFWYWLYLSNVKVSLAGAWQHQTLDITWSLAIEEHFYLLWPLVVARVAERRLLAVCAALFAGALAVRVALVAAGAPPLAAYTLTPCRVDTLAVGAALAIAAHRRGGLAFLAAPARRALPIAAALFAACYAWVRATLPGAAPGGGYEAATAHALAFTTHPLMQTAGYSLLCVVYGALLVVVATAPPGGVAARCFEQRWLRRVGEVSYGMYLFHLFVALLALALFAPGRYPDHYVPAQLFFWALVIGITYALARLSWTVFESPLLRLKRHFPYRV